MMDMISGIIGLANGLREQWLSKPVTYRTVDGVEHAIYATPWNGGFQSMQPIDYEQVSLSQKRAAFTVLKDQLIFDGVFRAPKEGDKIIEVDGTENTVAANENEPQWFYAPDNPEKNTIVVNCYRYGK